MPIIQVTANAVKQKQERPRFFFHWSVESREPSGDRVSTLSPTFTTCSFSSFRVWKSGTLDRSLHFCHYLGPKIWKTWKRSQTITYKHHKYTQGPINTLCFSQSLPLSASRVRPPLIPPASSRHVTSDLQRWENSAAGVGRLNVSKKLHLYPVRTQKMAADRRGSEEGSDVFFLRRQVSEAWEWEWRA